MDFTGRGAWSVNVVSEWWKAGVHEGEGASKTEGRGREEGRGTMFGGVSRASTWQ